MEEKYNWLNKRHLLSIDQLRLWNENPRLNPEETHLTLSDFTEDLIADEAEKSSFILLLKSISSGFIPADPIVVWKNSQNNKYYVAEGNRRVISLKLLRNPDKAPKSIRAFIRSLSTLVKREDIEKVHVNIAPTFDDAEWYINQRNSTSSLQRPWSRIQQQRWISNLYNKYEGDIDKLCSVTKMTKDKMEDFVRILRLVDLIKVEEVKSQLSEQEYKDATSYKFPITILERFFSNKIVKDQWGIDFEGTKLKLRNKAGFLNAYAALIKNIVSTDNLRIKIDTRTITSELDDILKGLPSVNLEQSDEFTMDGDTKQHEPSSEQEKSRKNTESPVVKNDPNRDKLILPIYKLASTDYRLNGLFNELKTLGKKYINVKAASLRVLLDLAVCNYIQSESLEADMKKEYKCNLRDIVLAKRLSYIQKNKLSSKTKIIVTKLMDDTSKYSLSILNGYVHGQNTCYLHHDFINSFFDFLFPLFSELLDIKEEKTK